MLSLEQALLTENYNFAELLESDDKTCFYFPYNWKLKTKIFFLRYLLLNFYKLGGGGNQCCL